jgi:RecA-family ATPase
VAGDNERLDRERAAEDQAKALRSGGNSYGFPALAETFGDAYARKIADWLGYIERNEQCDRPDAPHAAPARPVAIEIIDPSTLQGRPVPPREWHVADLIPHKTVTLKSGDGGVGKSLLAMQLCVSTALDKPWIGRDVARGRAMYLSAEDDMDEVHRRLFDICAGEGVRLADLGRLRIAPLAGLDAVLAAPQGKTNVIAATPLWKALEARCEEFLPRLLVLDTSADLFAGEENNRAQVRQFIGMLRGLAIRLDIAIVLLSHPSVAGMSSGSGTSGSTAWNNSVRSRLFFRREVSSDGIEADPNLRKLETMKANYSTTGAEITVRWEAGRFVPDRSATPNGLEQATAGMRADRVFMDLLRAYVNEGRYVSAQPGSTYAPIVFSRDARSSAFGKPALTAAMNRLLGSQAIRMEKFGPPSRQINKLVIADDPGAEKAEYLHAKDDSCSSA